MKTAKRNATLENLLKFISDFILIEVFNENGDEMCQYKIPKTDLIQSGKNIIINNLPISKNSKENGTITSVNMRTKSGTIVINNITFSDDNSKILKFNKLYFNKDENIRLQNAELLLNKVKVFVQTNILWVF